MESPSFHLEGVYIDKDDIKDFDGPLSLILLLLQKNKIEIRDIKIADILDQYLEYIETMQQLDLEVASEFIRMASYLLYIKTKTMLSSGEEVSELEILIESLEQLKAKDVLEQIDQVVPTFSDFYKHGVLYGTKAPEHIQRNPEVYQYKHSPAELLNALYNSLRLSKEKIVDTQTLVQAIPKRVVYSVRNKSRHILSRLRLRDIALNELYSECKSRSEIVATFVSVLELCAMGSVLISLSKDGRGYDLSFAGGNMDDILERIEDQ